ncbi:glycosyltransferase family 2 protein [Clostridium saccharoperbutylacetonicum]|uniref:glycosyltransferase family 2 protein n=1 Tax=Clostridium saccharoperbutylacetonicum TaxID=36745 RepID=UPI000983CE1A|nr:glycosyltransferase family 2 protein [Clostridium saccharoperbutylacetonicum]AQR96993.1 PGL/p-HBAD biosynthesis glycosyltransferase [Clostridium saccharoperbutylacetonicum]NSB32872.1 glycosyltransferase involved in cell wall biosynthesis [Clostridium saccharoperbutylacetonicum]
MKVSIITICLNSEKYIEQTIQSVLTQTYKDIEYIIIDGMSTDSTLDIIEKYKPLFKERLKVISEKDSGIYNAMNKGIKYSTGEVIGIINSDDWYEEDAVENVVEMYDSKDESIIYGTMVNRINNEISRIGIANYKELHNCMIGHPTVFVPRSIYDKFGFFDENFRIAADYELMLKFYSNKVNFKFVNKVIANFREGGISTTNIELCKKETLNIRKIYGYKNELFSIDPRINSEIKYLWDNLFINLEKNNSKKVYIYGSGVHTKELLNYMPTKIKEKVKGIIDRKVDKDTKLFEGYNKFEIEQIEDKADTIIISSFDYEYDIYNRIKYLKDKINIVRIYGANSIQEVNEIIKNRII